MSGSFDKPTSWPAAPAPRARVEAYQGAHTQAPPLAQRTQATARADAAGGEGRTKRSRGGTTLAPVVPAGSVTGRSLTLVITIMCFLASLTAGAVYMMNQSASDWLRGMAGEVTVLVEPKGRTGADTGKMLAEVTGFLSRQPGVTRARALTMAEIQELLGPWIGDSAALSELPVPRLIAVEVGRSSPSDIEGLRKALGANFPDAGVTLDDHRRYQAQIRTITRSFALGGFAILLLVGAATTAIIVSATKSAMASNRDIVEVLHFVGATDRFIAREFERHFLRLGVRAGVVGALWAVLVFLAMPTVMELLGGGAVTIAELRRLIGIASLDLPGYILLGIVVLVIAALCMLTSRIGVYRILNSQH